jgi:hypothetical protein
MNIEILNDNKEKMRLLLGEFEKNYVLYNMHPTVLDYETNFRNTKMKIQQLSLSNDEIKQKIIEKKAAINEKIDSMDKKKVNIVKEVKDNASIILKRDVNKEYTIQYVKNIEILSSILILLFLFYKGTR